MIEGYYEYPLLYNITKTAGSVKDKLLIRDERVNKTITEPSFVSYSITPTPIYSTVLNQTLNGTAFQYINTSDPLVQYDLECKSDEAYCSKISKAVGAAIDEFTRVVNVKNSLLIKVTYYSFCEVACSNDTYGWGIPTSQFTLPFEEGADLNYVYPQALAKQLAPYSSTSVWSQYDVEITINHDVYMNAVDSEEEWNSTKVPPNGKFWFSSDSDILDYQIDFRIIVLHELLHGLGLLSAWAAYFSTNKSPFKSLVEGIIDPLELQIVTPGPYWYINQDTGPAYITGFQPTMIFDKYLMVIDSSFSNTTQITSLSTLSFDMQNFCVNTKNDAFIINFIRLFNAANQSSTAHKLWVSLSQPGTLRFQFQPSQVENSTYNLNPYLNQTYRSMTLMTGQNLFSEVAYETTDPAINRPGLTLAHLDDSYVDTVDFLMTQEYPVGKTLDTLVVQYYGTIPPILYNSTSNNTKKQLVYRSPIGPGVLRMLDSIGYSTILTRTNYTTEGNVKAPKPHSSCDDNNSNRGIKPTPSLTSKASYVSHSFRLYTVLIIIMQFPFFSQ
ncbi:hypothetical protein BY458DRAFT_438638 [Sporodiniella umbellata]|nr:hypothetical protein BY458DRAFT_438638 [Sporodiniella umbellata]